ncbi:hypothetical protein [Spartinivicinus poritis]|uniref:Uncharacterized protein n=1 Tax=Spartinivicinus poritis TaxID=2994640 RepID=A0ABT5UDV9_9GAMM|nr:hypothetical protein [Spartinivicinus sp. A2-2]MDE1464557.1 hypothetical protein [Spartinivicinus sp. A2-2]
MNKLNVTSLVSAMVIACTVTAQAVADGRGEVRCQYWDGREAANEHSCRWVNGDRGEGHHYAVWSGGYENYGRHNQSKTSVCRDRYNLGGKLVNNICWVPLRGREYGNENYQMLVIDNNNYHWDLVTGRVETNYDGMIRNNSEGSFSTFVCKVVQKAQGGVDGDTVTGKYIDDICWYSYNGREYAAAAYDQQDNRDVYVLKFGKK